MFKIVGHNGQNICFWFSRLIMACKNCKKSLTNPFGQPVHKIPVFLKSFLNFNQNALLFPRHLGNFVLHQLEPKTVTMTTEMVALSKNHLFPTAAAVAVKLTT